MPVISPVHRSVDRGSRVACARWSLLDAMVIRRVAILATGHRLPAFFSTVMEPDREQADLPAEQPPSRQDARLPAAHAHPRRPRHPLRAPPQGPRRAVGLSRPRTPRAASTNRCCPHPTGCVDRLISPLSSAPARAPGGARSSFTSLDRRRPSPVNPESVWSSVETVGDSVVRHRVSRRLRAQLATRLGSLPRGSSRRGPGAARRGRRRPRPTSAAIWMPPSPDSDGPTSERACERTRASDPQPADPRGPGGDALLAHVGQPGVRRPCRYTPTCSAYAARGDRPLRPGPGQLARPAPAAALPSVPPRRARPGSRIRWASRDSSQPAEVSAAASPPAAETPSLGCRSNSPCSTSSTPRSRGCCCGGTTSSPSSDWTRTAA